MTDKQNELIISQIELLNDFSISVYNRLLRYAIKNKIDLENKNQFINLILRQLEENLSIKLSDKNLNELEEIKKYWDHMNDFVKEITGNLSLDSDNLESIQARQDVLTGNVETFETIDNWWQQSINE